MMIQHHNIIIIIIIVILDSGTPSLTIFTIPSWRRCRSTWETSTEKTACQWAGKLLLNMYRYLPSYKAVKTHQNSLGPFLINPALFLNFYNKIIVYNLSSCFSQGNFCQSLLLNFSRKGAPSPHSAHRTMTPISSSHTTLQDSLSGRASSHSFSDTPEQGLFKLADMFAKNLTRWWNPYFIINI